MERRATARGVLARAVATLRRHWRPILLVALVVFVPLGLLDVLDEHVSELDTDELDTADAIGVLVIALTAVTTELFGEIILAGVIAAAVGDIHGTRDERSLPEVLAKIPYARLVAITVISVVAFVLGLLLLVLPGILFLGWFVLAAPVAEVEDLGVRAAFARSRELTRGHVGLVLGLLIPLTLVFGAAGEAAQAAGVGLLGEGLVGEWLGAVVFGVLTATPWALAAVSLVYELRSAEGGAAQPAATRSSPPPPR
jgi:hypothetical protein